jgi:hypothetical protein
LCVKSAKPLHKTLENVAPNVAGPVYSCVPACINNDNAQPPEQLTACRSLIHLSETCLGLQTITIIIERRHKRRKLSPHPQVKITAFNFVGSVRSAHVYSKQLQQLDSHSIAVVRSTIQRELDGYNSRAIASNRRRPQFRNMNSPIATSSAAARTDLPYVINADWHADEPLVTLRNARS